MWAKTLKTSIHILCCLQGIRPTSHLHGSNYTIQEHIWRSIYLMARLAQQWMKEQGIIFDALGPRSIFSGLSGSLGGWLKGALYSVFCPCTFNQKKKNTNTQTHKAITHQAVYKSVHHNVFLIQEIPPCWILLGDRACWNPCSFLFRPQTPWRKRTWLWMTRQTFECLWKKTAFVL